MADNEIVERNPDGSLVRVRFRAVPAVATPGAMDQLVERYRAAIDRRKCGAARRRTPRRLRLPLHPPIHRRQRPHRAPGHPAPPLPLRVRGRALHQPRADLRGVQGDLLRDAGDIIPGLARGQARHPPVAALLLGRHARAPTASSRSASGRSERARGSKTAHIRRVVDTQARAVRDLGDRGGVPRHQPRHDPRRPADRCERTVCSRSRAPAAARGGRSASRNAKPCSPGSRRPSRPEGTGEEPRC